MAPTFLMLEQTAAATIEREPETEHERTFCAVYAERLRDAVQALHQAPLAAHPGDAAAAFAPLKKLAAELDKICR